MAPPPRLLLPSLVLVLVLLVISAWVPPPAVTAPGLAAYPWLYLRDGRALDAGEQVVEVIATGDVMPGRGVAGEQQPFAAVAPWLRAFSPPGLHPSRPRLVLGNLECVIATGGVARPGPYRLRAPLPAAGARRDAGFDVLGLANNHTLDYGPAGLAETMANLEEAGIDTVGAGPTLEAASQPLIRRSGEVRLAFLAFNAVPDPAAHLGGEGWTVATWDPARARAAIAQARTQAEAVIVSIHWGYEYDLRPDPAQREMAQTMLEAGADLVVGHHPHVVQGTMTRLADFRSLQKTSEVWRDGFVAYSLGNFVFDQQQGEARQGLALRAYLDRQGLRAVQALPLWAGPRPRLMDLDEAAALLARVQPQLPRLGFACDGEACSPTTVLQATQAGPFRAGAIDLTGDGVAESVRLLDGQVVVYSQGAEAWRGLPEWRVVDLALGDPNDDGRGELLLALWKPDGKGVSRSHPFVAGYREGAYRVLWGGSAVPDPIHEVELGDVDGDGVQELVVLEERDGARAVSVWRWHGWGFSLTWRSPAGHYRDLALLPGGAGDPSKISVGAEP